ncbi:MAG: TonB-dependent receptor [Bryobacterales bacterium]|nr:TonB-dependent receptor [Bryobacterales bacterium]
MFAKLLPFAAGLCLPAMLAAQTMNTGTLLGSVKDPTGAAVPEAVVKVQRANPPFERVVNTDAAGNYLAPQVPPGVYQITFEKTGFQRVVQGGVDLSAAQSLRVDATLTLGSVSETVEVNAIVAQVDTATANVGSTIFGGQVQELALNTRSFTQLMTLQPGVSSLQAQQPGFGSNTSVPFSFNGGQTSANNWTLDGGRNIDTYNGNNLSMVNLDAIAEVRVERNAYSSEYGRNGGAQVNVVTKSGTNEFHGTLFEFFRNDKLDARNFFARTRPKNRYNNFGGTIGGPIKKDKLFFFLSNEYRRIQQNTGARTSTVPTGAQIGGDFTGGRTINNPETGQPFPGNRIPANLIDPNAVRLIQTYYLPPTPGFQSGALNFTSTEPDGTRYRSALGRFDYNWKPNLLLFGRFNIDSTRLLSPYGLFATNPMHGVADSEQAHIIRVMNLSANWSASPTLVNQITSAFFHTSLAISTGPNASRNRAPQLTIPRVFNAPTASGGFIPSISLAQGYAGVDIRWPQNISGYTWELVDNLSWQKGRHSLKFGGSIDKENKSQNQSNPNNNGTFTFNGSATGDALADFIVGRAFQYTENSNHVFGVSRWTNYSLYAQDQIRATSRLSLTMGLRWEFYQPEQDSDGYFSFFQPSRFDRARAAQVLPNGQIVTGTENFDNGIVLAGTPNAPFGKAMTNSVWNTFAPRVGFSYALTKDNLTVLRGGIGMFHDRWSQFVSTVRNNWPFNQSASLFTTQLSNPAGGQRRLFPIALSNFNSPWEIPYYTKWSLGIQRQLPKEMLLDVSYVASRGTQLVRTRDINQPVASVAVANGSVNPNAARPFPGFAGISTFETSGNSIYHSMQVSATRRLSKGFAFQGSYTFSRSIDNNVTPINSYADNRMERALSSFDRTHILALSYVYELPFFRDASSALARRVLGGWQISGINRFESGLPLTVSIPGDRAGVGGGGQRPDLIGAVTMDRTLARWFNTGAFANPALGTFGSAGRSLVRAPGINNWDVSFIKATQLKERMALQFRAEFFNLFNHTQWAGVNTSFGAAAFGQVTSARDPRITQLGLRLLF